VRQRFRFLLLALISIPSLYAVGNERAFSSASFIPPAPFVQEITEANWQFHPKTRQVRAIVQSVKAGMSLKVLKTKRRVFEYCEPGADTKRTIATDAKGRARFYETEGGSEDSSLKMEHYYDERGRLRFVFITGGAVNGSQLEHRIYFDETGKRIWEKQTYTKGPGYTFPTVWPDDQLQLKGEGALEQFIFTSPCPEQRAPGKRRRTR
jgi:hypothetical protein